MISMDAESLQQVVELLPGPALVVGPAGELLGANDRAGGWIGAGRDRLLGGSLDRFVADPPERVAGFLDECRRADRKVGGVLTPMRDGRAGGACRVEGIAVRPRPGGGDPAMVVVHVLPGAPDGGEAAAEALREELRRKDEFLDRVAHDLRNPVAALSGALHVVRAATAPEDVAWAEGAVERQVRHLVRQLDGLLEIARITRGRVELRAERLDAAAAARAAAAAARPMIEERDLRLTLSASPGELAVVADPARLEQILVGLLGQVVGSAEPGGGIRLSVAREGDAIVFRARDRGEDPADEMPPAASGPAEAGDAAGIGMMLVRKLTELHGGSAWSRGEGPGRGTEYAVRLPAAGPTASTAAPDRGARPASAAGARVLVVDDNVDAARGTARLLQLAGHAVRVAHDGRQALEIADEHRPRFILLDIALPGMDGYEVARRLRADPRHRDAVIVAVSGYSQDDYQQPREAGFDHHLVKPVDYNALRAILDRAAPGAD
jgi:CheY-like chemotaxis protein